MRNAAVFCLAALLVAACQKEEPKSAAAPVKREEPKSVATPVQKEEAKSAAAPVQDVEALEVQLSEAREAAPMVLKPFLLVARPANYFGDYEVRPDAAFGRGSKIHFYAEPKNLVMNKGPSGMFEPALEVDIEVKPEKGETIKKDGFMSIRIPSKSRIQDLYLNLDVSLGQAPAGKYNIEFTVRDLNSKKSAVAAQEITLR